MDSATTTINVPEGIATDFVTFRLGDRILGLDARMWRDNMQIQIDRPGDQYHPLNQPVLRGFAQVKLSASVQSFPVFDLHAFVGDRSPFSPNPVPVILVNYLASDFGLIVDEVIEIGARPKDEIEYPTSSFGNRGHAYLRDEGTCFEYLVRGKRNALFILDPTKLFLPLNV